MIGAGWLHLLVPSNLGCLDICCQSTVEPYSSLRQFTSLLQTSAFRLLPLPPPNSVSGIIAVSLIPLIYLGLALAKWAP
jgi:hypothetical protein